MCQPKKEVKIWMDRLARSASTRLKTAHSSADDDMVIRRAELTAILQQFAEKEERFLTAISQLEKTNRQLNSLVAYQEQECERSRHLLSIKEQLCITQQRQIEQLKGSLRTGRKAAVRQPLPRSYLHHSNLNQEQDLNELSKIESIDEDDSQEKENRGFETKRKICLKKSIKAPRTPKIPKTTNLHEEGQHLEIAKLKSEIAQLQECISNLQVQLQILEIDNQHIGRDCEISSKRERRLQEAFTSYLQEQSVSKAGEENSLSSKCVMLERYIDKLTEKVVQETEKMDHPQFNPLPNRKGQDVPPPITPHFSNTTFVFPFAGKKTPTKQQSPPHDEIFQAYSSFCEQDCPQKQ